MVPGAFHNLLPEAFRDLKQHDAMEFLHALVAALNDDKVVNMFTMFTKTSMRCDSCGEGTMPRLDSSLCTDLCFDMGATSHGETLQSLLNKAFAPEWMCGRERFKCTSAVCKDSLSTAQL